MSQWVAVDKKAILRLNTDRTFILSERGKRVMEGKKNIQGKRPVTADQMNGLVTLLVQGIPADMTFGDAEYCLGNKRLIHEQERKLLFRGITPEEDALADWQQTYVAATGCAFSSFDDVKATMPLEGFDRLVVVQRDMSLTAIRELYAEAEIGLNFRDISEDDLELVKNSRYDDSVGRRSYAIRTRGIFQPDMVDMSAEELTQLEVLFMNLPEFLLLFWKYWQETGLPFDNGMFTLLPDSWFEDGTVPCVSWTGARVEIFKAPRDLKGAHYGARHISIS